MKLKELFIKNFRGIEEIKINLGGRSAVFFGINGTGKTTVLKSICLLYANIINNVVNRSSLKQNFKLSIEDIRFGKGVSRISAIFEVYGKVIPYSRTIERKSGKRTHDALFLKLIVESFQDIYEADSVEGLPVFVNYGTNRLVLDIPLRIRQHSEFDSYSAFEKAIESKIDFRSFFTWYRDQEDYENQVKVVMGDNKYEDRSLSAVRRAALSMLDGCCNLRVDRKPRLEMKVEKNGMNLSVSQLSDGEKCVMAMFGDLARRLSLANPHMDNPLLGQGVVLIDEVDLHLHPTWQREILKKLHSTFPNIQFIVTTHSHLVMSEAGEDFDLFFLESKDNRVIIQNQNRLDGYSANYILEEYMDTGAQKSSTKGLISDIYRFIDENQFDKAEELILKLEKITDSDYEDVILTKGYMLKKKRINEKNK